MTAVAASGNADWRAHEGGTSSRLAVLLTEPESAWTGLAHGLATIGVRFTITDDVAATTRHEVVVAYPVISGSVLGGGMNGVFGFEESVAARDRRDVIHADQVLPRLL